MGSPGPQLQVHIQKLGFELITPEALSSSKRDVIFSRGGVEIARVSPTLVVKYGDAVQLVEARSMEFVAKHTSLPVPHVYAAYTYGPFEERDEESFSKYDTYIFMEFIDGQTLEKEWPSLDNTAKSNIITELKAYFTQLRTIPGGTYIGSLDDGPVKDSILEFWSMKGKESYISIFKE
jgi:aminoglycoside phosphotransferase (APT) family kinase protein